MTRPLPPLVHSDDVLAWINRHRDEARQRVAAARQSRRGRSMLQFIRARRSEIDDAIRRTYPNIGRLDDDNRRHWILNNELLYRWARREGVRC